MDLKLAPEAEVTLCIGKPSKFLPDSCTEDNAILRAELLTLISMYLKGGTFRQSLDIFLALQQSVLGI